VRALAEVIAASPIPNARIAFEVRHRSWFAFATNGVLELLHELRWCLVEHPNRKLYLDLLFQFDPADRCSSWASLSLF
jgi:uncharacterized protein YecE (DUF72 family)